MVRGREMGSYFDREPTIWPALVGALGLVAYYLLVWLLRGRSPRPDDAGVSAAPPEGISPAEARMIWRMALDDRAFAVALVSLAAKGYLTIFRSSDGVYRARQSPKAEVALAPEERAVAEALFATWHEVSLDKNNSVTITEAKVAFERALRRSPARRRFRTNEGFVLAGWLIAAVIVFVTGALAPVEGGGAIAGLLALFLLIMGAVSWQLLRAGRGEVRDDPKDNGRRSTHVTLERRLLGLFFATLATGLFAALAWLVSWLAAASLTMMLAASAAFPWLVRTRTRAGQEIADQLEAFRRYLASPAAGDTGPSGGPYRAAAAERNDLAYALALEVDHGWSARFAHLCRSPAASWDGKLDESFMETLAAATATEPLGSGG
jgi:hypothetical protein